MSEIDESNPTNIVMVINHLNSDFWNAFPEESAANGHFPFGLFEYVSFGDEDLVKFLGYPLWCSGEDDDRHQNDDGDYIESLRDCLVRKADDVLNELSKIRFSRQPMNCSTRVDDD
jgi:hypothetical protein